MLRLGGDARCASIRANADDAKKFGSSGHASDFYARGAPFESLQEHSLS